MLTYLQDTDRLSVYVVYKFELSFLPIAICIRPLLCDILVAYGPLSLINHQLCEVALSSLQDVSNCEGDWVLR